VGTGRFWNNFAQAFYLIKKKGKVTLLLDKALGDEDTGKRRYRSTNS
jgi:hypothetical protein